MKSALLKPTSKQDFYRGWNKSLTDVAAELQTDAKLGLSSAERQRRQSQHPPNSITSQQKITPLQVLVRQFRSLLVLLLAVAAGISFFNGELLEGAAIVAVLVVNGLMGFFTEMKAMRSMDALRKMGQTHCQIIVDGQRQSILAEDLLPGDLLFLEAGDLVMADARLVTSDNLSVDEASLTGESVPVDKDATKQLQADTLLADRNNMVMRGTGVTRGLGTAIVVTTGMQTELGQVAELTTQAEKQATPLQKKLDRLGARLFWLTLVIAVFIFASGWFSGKSLFVMLQTAIALAVATVPEGLPIVATIALARGMWVMAQKNALINRLSAVETLGATTIIVTDKTGTLTENNMTVQRVETPWGSWPFSTRNPADQWLMGILYGCNDAQINAQGEELGDPMEIALIRFALDHRDSFPNLIEDFPRHGVIPFSADTKMMATFHPAENNRLFQAVKGAPEQVLARCNQWLMADGRSEPLTDETRQHWEEQNHKLASEGFRVLGLACAWRAPDEPQSHDNLCFVGLVGLVDPPRKDVPSSIDLCHQAGIRVIMATGDQVGTAGKIAVDIGIPADAGRTFSGAHLPTTGEWYEEQVPGLAQASIFSRVSPEQKLRLVEFFQKQGEVVAMTGDGVNDAPALKKADIGVAMGIRGTEVAKQAADMILRDDRFSSIVSAVHQGRIVFGNIRKFVVYLLSCNISEVFVVGLASAFTTQLPITPLQILFLNLVTDVFPALALGMGEGNDKIMSQPPRPTQEKIIEPRHWFFIFNYGLWMTALVLIVFLGGPHYLGFSVGEAVTMSFLTLGFAQLFHIFNLRDQKASFFKNEITQNPYVWGAIALCILLFALVMAIPVARVALSLTPLSVEQWGLVALASLSVGLGQLAFKRLR